MKYFLCFIMLFIPFVPGADDAEQNPSSDSETKISLADQEEHQLSFAEYARLGNEDVEQSDSEVSEAIETVPSTPGTGEKIKPERIPASVKKSDKPLNPDRQSIKEQDVPPSSVADRIKLKTSPKKSQSRGPADIKKVYKKNTVVIKRDLSTLDDAVKISEKDQNSSQDAVDVYYNGDRQPSSFIENEENSISHLDYGDYEIQWNKKEEEKGKDKPWFPESSPF